MNIVTGYVGQPHITANEAQALNQGIIGSGNYVLDVGSKFAATLESATSVAIQDGEGVIQGVQFRIAPGDVESVTISPGTTGYKRIDYICARYTKSALTGIEDVSLVVVEGTPDASTPAAPTVNEGTILIGGSPVDFPLWEVDLDGLTPTLKSLINEVPYPTIHTVGAAYELPFKKWSQYHDGITRDRTRLIIIPAIKMMIIDISYGISANTAYSLETVGYEFPIIDYYGNFFYNLVCCQLYTGAATAPSALAMLSKSKGSTVSTDCELEITIPSTNEAKTYCGQIIARYTRLHPSHPFSDAVLIED